MCLLSETAGGVDGVLLAACNMRHKDDSVVGQLVDTKHVFSSSRKPYLVSLILTVWAERIQDRVGIVSRVVRFRSCPREVGRQAGDYLRQYRKSHGLELGYALMASAALLNCSILCTRDRKTYLIQEL